jgi:hypothetical protein
MTAFQELAEARQEDWHRHMDDLIVDRYETGVERAERDRVFVEAFELCTPVALRVLERIDELLLGRVATITTRRPEPDGQGGLVGGWELTWPALERSRSRFTGRPLPPCVIGAMYPTGFTHGHVALYDISEPRRCIAAWPLQVTSPADAERQEPILWTIAEAEVHDRTFQTDLNWRLLRFAREPA